MSALAQRREPIRSRKLLDSARGQPCTLQFEVCNSDTETTVSCHIHDETFGMAMKADDFDTVHGCHACHMYLDHGWAGKISQAILLRHILRAVQRTNRNRRDRGLIVIQEDLKPRPRETPPRKPKEQRAPIHNASGFRRAASNTRDINSDLDEEGHTNA